MVCAGIARSAETVGHRVAASWLRRLSARWSGPGSALGEAAMSALRAGSRPTQGALVLPALRAQAQSTTEGLRRRKASLSTGSWGVWCTPCGRCSALSSSRSIACCPRPSLQRTPVEPLSGAGRSPISCPQSLRPRPKSWNGCATASGGGTKPPQSPSCEPSRPSTGKSLAPLERPRPSPLSKRQVKPGAIALSAARRKPSCSGAPLCIPRALVTTS